MSDLPQSVSSVPAAGRTREQQAREELGHTLVQRPVAWVLVIGLVATILVELVVQHVAAISASSWPHTWDLARQLPETVSAMTTAARAEKTWPASASAANADLRGRMQRWEDDLKESSLVGKAIRPPVQTVLSALGVGNESVCLGRNGWLFYRPEIEYLTGAGFLEEQSLIRRRAAGCVGDPRPAIMAFQQQLRARGITLIIMPTPCKPMLHPEMLVASMSKVADLQNSSYRQMVADLTAAGVSVFDATKALQEAKNVGRAQFLERDTHWRPEAMENCADQLAGVVRQKAVLSLQTVPYRRLSQTARQVGDLAEMLDLPPGHNLRQGQEVAVHPVVNANGTPWRAQPGAQVLLLGDSYTNIYSQPGLGWGEGAGLAEQLSYYLQCPVDCIARNDGGAWATRAVLSRELTGGRDHLAGKQVVIWQFAVRELALGDWREIDLARN